MAQIRILKLDSTSQLPTEHALSDDVTFGSLTVNGGGPVVSSSGLDMNNLDIIDVQDLAFVNPATATINQTAGNLVINNIMAKDRDNVMQDVSSVIFPATTDVAGKVDLFKLPDLAGSPSATPAYSSDAGYMLYDSSNKKLFIWDGSSWDDQSTVSSASSLDNSYLAEAAVSIRDAVYISSADNVKKAQGDADATRDVIGFATASQPTPGSAVVVRSGGILSGFSGLTAGARYYLSAASAGAIVSTPPTSSGSSVVSVGFAKSATALAIQIQFIGKKA